MGLARPLPGNANLDLARARYAIEHYEHLLGLRLIPLAACFLGSAAWRVGLLSWLPGAEGRGARRWFVASLVVALLLSVPIRTVYRRRVGVALPRPARTGAPTLMISFVSFIVLASTSFHTWTVPVAVLFVALELAYLGTVEGGLRRHYLAIAAGCLVYGISPLLGVSSEARSVGLDLLIGVGLIVAGVGDHMTLRRVLNERNRQCPHHLKIS